MYNTLIRSAVLLAGTAYAACPYATGELGKREAIPQAESPDFLSKFTVDDSQQYLTSDAGGPIDEQISLKAGLRGPTLLEDFVFRQKITHFDHERVPERAVHARGAGAHGTFVSYGNFGNITGASFLNKAGKETPVFVRFSTVAGSRGSADTARDVHGFATRFYTDEGNFDIVGNNVPVFFIQDAIKFPDLIHAVKPHPASEIPQAATAHDSAWDFFSQQPSTLHTLFWAMSGHGIVRSYRHMDGFGVHTFRFVTDEGKSKLVKFHFKSLQGKASLVWEEAQQAAGKNADYHRGDLFDNIAKGRFPEWEFGVQVFSEEDQLRFGFDVLDPTKIVPEELVPVTPLGKLQLNRNPLNYFAEVEQVMFQPAHLVRGIDLSEDPLLQGRLFSYLDTQLNRHNGPNFEQLPINQPRVQSHNNNRDGAGQMFIPTNTAAYSPNTLNGGYPKQATQKEGRGFFTAPDRGYSGTIKLVRETSDTFADVWSQPRLFFNSITPAEQQFLVNAIRFETSNLQSTTVKQNVLTQLNRVSHDLAVRVASALGMTAPAEDAKYYHNNKTSNVGAFGQPLSKIDGLKVGLLTTNSATNSTSALKASLAASNVDVIVVAERLGVGIDQTYSATDAIQFDAVMLTDESGSFISGNTTSTLFPAGRPAQIVTDSYRFGKPIAAMGRGIAALKAASVPVMASGVYTSSDQSRLADQLKEGLKAFKFLDRFPVDK